MKMAKDYMKMAQDFIAKTDLTKLATGTHVIDEGNLWVNIVDSNLREPKDALLEAHDVYIDIQIPLSCPESYGVKKRSECKSPRGEMDTKKDIIFFDDAFDEIITAQVGEQVIFEPDTAHAPLLGSGTIHKAIFKVRK